MSACELGHPRCLFVGMEADNGALHTFGSLLAAIYDARMSTWRAARESDDESIVEMFIGLNREDPGQAPVSPENMRRTLRALRERPDRGLAVVLETERGVSGYALLIPFWSNELGGECCSLDELYVLPEVRRRHHASALIAALKSGAGLWPRKAPAIVLEVSPENTRALALYRRLGFRGGNLSLRLLTDLERT